MTDEPSKQTEARTNTTPRHAPVAEELQRLYYEPQQPPLPAGYNHLIQTGGDSRPGQGHPHAETPAAPTIPAWLAPAVAAVRTGAIRRHVSEVSQNPPPRTHRGQRIRPSAVLIAIAGDPTFTPQPGQPFPPDARVVLTHRAPTLRSHSGQMAFPGGRADDTDAGPIATALREAAEEVALRAESVTPLAVASPLAIHRTGNVVTPVLAYWHTPHPLAVASPTEVARVLEVPLATLVEPSNRFALSHQGWIGPGFWVDDLLLWGFTGGVVDALLRAAGWETPWPRQPVRDLFDALAESANNESYSELAGPDTFDRTHLRHNGHRRPSVAGVPAGELRGAAGAPGQSSLHTADGHTPPREENPR